MNKNLKYWLALNQIIDLGPITIKKLWEHFGSIEAVWRAPEKEVLEIEGVYKPAVKALVRERGRIDPEAELKKIDGATQIVTLEDPGYPAVLKNIYDPPPVLYLRGNYLSADQKAIAIVGTRQASHYGLEVAERFARELALLGITIISGMALGIDTAAHLGALSAKGRTIAVFGCGVDVIYPPSNRGLAEEIEMAGALISEFPLGTKGEKGNFPRRNRLISGLSLGVIVVEGHFDSGAMITAKEALEQGREVFAVPGNVALEQSKGPHWLIKQGAKLVESVEDVLDELKSQIPTSKFQIIPKSQIQSNNYSDLLPDEQKIVAVLSAEPKHIDVIAAETGLAVSQVSGLLMMLEVKKIIRQLPGKYFVLGSGNRGV